MEPSLMNAGQVVANTDWECSVMVNHMNHLSPMQMKFCYFFFPLSQALRAKTFLPDLVPPNRYLPPPSFFDSTHPPGLTDECDALFSFFAPAFTGQRYHHSLLYVNIIVTCIYYAVPPSLTVPPQFLWLAPRGSARELSFRLLLGDVAWTSLRYGIKSNSLSMSATDSTSLSLSSWTVLSLSVKLWCMQRRS